MKIIEKIIVSFFIFLIISPPVFGSDQRIERLIYIQNIFKDKNCYKKWNEVLKSSSKIMWERFWNKDIKKFRQLHKIWCDTLYNPNAKEKDIVFLYFMNTEWGKIIEISDTRSWVTSVNANRALKGAYLIKENGGWKRCGLHSMVEISIKDMELLNQKIKDYYNNENKFPSRLEDLIPVYIKILSSDPFSPENDTYKYKPSITNWIIYSVGIDGKDDLGLVKYHLKSDPLKQNFSYGDIILSDKAG